MAGIQRFYQYIYIESLSFFRIPFFICLLNKVYSCRAGIKRHESKCVNADSGRIAGKLQIPMVRSLCGGIDVFGDYCLLYPAICVKFIFTFIEYSSFSVFNSYNAAISIVIIHFDSGIFYRHHLAFVINIVNYIISILF